MIRRPPRSIQIISSAASDVYKRQIQIHEPRVAVYEVVADWEEDRNELNVSVSYLILGLTPKIDDVSIAFKP